MTKFATQLLAGAAILAVPLAAHAGPTPPPSVCSVSDIGLTIAGTSYSPVQCVSDIQTGANNPATETAALGAAFTLPLLTFLAKDDGSTGALNGIQFAMDTPTGTTWTVSWTDINGAAAANLPVTIDFAVLINGGNNGSGYLFNDVLLPAPPNNSGGGSFAISFFNNGGQHPALSHMILAGIDVQPVIIPPCTANCAPDPQAVVPEPASMALLGTGLLGLIAARRRRA